MKRENIEDRIAIINRITKEVAIRRDRLHKGKVLPLAVFNKLDVPIDVAVIGATPLFAWLNEFRNHTIITLQLLDFHDRTISCGIGVGFGMFLKLTLTELAHPCLEGLILGMAEDFTLEQPAG